MSFPPKGDEFYGYHPLEVYQGELTNMKAQLGKQTGVALALLATLLATFLAIGVFTVAQADEHSANRSISPAEVEPGGIVTVTIELSGDYGTGGSVTDTLPGGYELVTDPPVEFDAAGFSRPTTGEVRVILTAAGATAVTYQVRAPSALGASDRFEGTFVDFDSNREDIGGDYMITVVEDATEPATDDAPAPPLKLSSSVAGDAVQVVIKATADTPKDSDNDITVDLKKFGVPTTIPERSIIIANDTPGVDSTQGNARYIGEPGSVTVNGTKLTLALYARFPGQSSGVAGTLDGGYTITIKQSAGVTNPTVAGTASVQVKDGDPADHNLTSKIDSKVKLSKGAAARGTDITVSGVGLGKGGATVYLVDGLCPDQGKDAAGDDCEEEDDISLGNAPTSGGKVSIDVETSSSDFIRGADQVDKDGVILDRATDRRHGFESSDALRGMNQITIVDGTGRTADKAAWFMITPTISVDDESAQQGDELTIDVEDWFNEDSSPGHFKVTVGNETASVEDTEFDDGDGEIEILVPTSARLGEQELKVISTRSTDLEGSLIKDLPDVAKGSVVIGALDMILEPSTVVLGQQFTVKVNGFSTEDPPADDRATADRDESDPIQLVKIGDLTLEETTGGESVNELTIDTNGDFTNTFVVKSTFKDAANNEASKELTPGTYRVHIRDHSGRIAIGRLTIPEPAITIDPPVSRRGTTVTLVGSNFPASRVVEIFYKEATDELLQGAVLADSAGKIRVNFSVPSDAEIGEEQDVIALSAANKAKFKAKAVHALPDQEIIVTPTQVSAGGRLDIEGHNMPLFTLVGLRIADISVAGKGAETNGLGSFLKEAVLVPQLKPGTHTVEATVQTQGGVAKVRTTIEIVDIITRDSDEAFADLIDNGTLTRVWHLDAQSQTWSFFDPAPEFADFNTLTEVSSGQIVTIIMATQDEFQGKSLYVGSNNVAIE